MHFKIAAFLSLATGLILSGCNSSTTTTTDVAVALEAHSWKLSAVTAVPAVSYNGHSVVNVYDSLPAISACDKHKISTFKSDHTSAYTADSTGCIASDTGSGTWSLNSSQTVLTEVKGTVNGDTNTYNIISVTGTTLKWTVEVTPGQADSISHVATETLSAQ